MEKRVLVAVVTKGRPAELERGPRGPGNADLRSASPADASSSCSTTTPPGPPAGGRGPERPPRSPRVTSTTPSRASPSPRRNAALDSPRRTSTRCRVRRDHASLNRTGSTSWSGSGCQRGSDGVSGSRCASRRTATTPVLRGGTLAAGRAARALPGVVRAATPRRAPVAVARLRRVIRLQERRGPAAAFAGVPARHSLRVAGKPSSRGSRREPARARRGDPGRSCRSPSSTSPERVEVVSRRRLLLVLRYEHDARLGHRAGRPLAGHAGPGARERGERRA